MEKVFGGVNHNVEFPTFDSIENFVYDGLFVESKKGFAKYKVVSLVEWTNDPGIGKFLCSDGKERLIPSCQLTKEFLSKLPKESVKGVLFGQPSKS